jgi:epoxyqueuosine reductase
LSLTDELKKRAGADVFGVADADSYGGKAPESHRPADVLKEARSIVIIGTRMLDLPLDRLPATRPEYTANFHIANTGLNDRLYGLARFLEEKGFKAYPIPYKEMPGWNLEKRNAALISAMRPLLSVPPVGERVADTLWENLSYRHMAVEAGLGQLGVNNLLLTPEHGPRIRFVALLTDAELDTGTPLDGKLCLRDRCGLACVKACPVGALSEDGSPTDKAKCLKYYLKLGVPGQSGVRCGLCVAKCPAHRKNFNR